LGTQCCHSAFVRPRITSESPCPGKNSTGVRLFAFEESANENNARFRPKLHVRPPVLRRVRRRRRPQGLVGQHLVIVVHRQIVLRVARQRRRPRSRAAPGDGTRRQPQPGIGVIQATCWCCFFGAVVFLRSMFPSTSLAFRLRHFDSSNLQNRLISGYRTKLEKTGQTGTGQK